MPSASPRTPAALLSRLLVGACGRSLQLTLGEETRAMPHRSCLLSRRDIENNGSFAMLLQTKSRKWFCTRHATARTTASVCTLFGSFDPLGPPRRAAAVAAAGLKCGRSGSLGSGQMARASRKQLAEARPGSGSGRPRPPTVLGAGICACLNSTQQSEQQHAGPPLQKGGARKRPREVFAAGERHCVQMAAGLGV